MLAYSYIRFSSKKQATGDSLRRQTAKTEEWSQRTGIPLASSNFEDLGVSAWTGENWREGGLSMFLAAVRSGKIKTPAVLVIENLDRLSRDEISHALTIFQDILRAGITIQTLSPEKTYPPDFAKGGALAMLEPIVTFLLANEESNKKSERLKATWKNKRKQGGKMGALCPAWLRWNAETKEYEIIEEKAEIVREIYRMSAEGKGSFAIIRELHAKKIKSIGWRKRKEKNSDNIDKGRWNHSYVSLLLHHRGVIGERVFTRPENGKRVKAETIKGYYPPIIERALFFKVQEQLAIRDNNARFRGRGAKTTRNLFSGLLVDARDGSTLILHHQRKNGKIWQYVVSHDALRKMPDSCFITFPYPELEFQILLTISSHLSTSDFTGMQREDMSDELQNKEAELKETEANIKEVQSRILKRGNAKTFIDLLDDLESNRERLAKDVDLLRSKTVSDPLQQMVAVCDEITAMQNAKGKARDNIRERLRGQIRLMIEKVYVVLSKSKSKKRVRGNPNAKHAFAEVRLRNGDWWQFEITYDKGDTETEWEGQSDIRLDKLPKSFDRLDPFARLEIED